MRIAVMGAGGIGGCLGGLLARAGEDVTLIARGANLNAIRNNGLTVKSLDFGEFRPQVKVTDSPHEAGEVDLILFCVKAYDTPDAAKQMGPMIGPETVVLSVQNGIDQEDVIAGIVGHDHVIGSTTLFTAHLEEPGVVTQLTNFGIMLGELEGGISPRIESLVKTLENAGVKSQARDDIRVAMWEKFAVFCSLVGLEVLSRLPAGPIMECAESMELLKGMLEEIAAVAPASGVNLYPEFVDKSVDLLNTLPPSHIPSMYHDMMSGKRLELDALNGTLVRLGRENGVPVPLNFAIYAALKPFADGAPNIPS